MLTTTEGDSDDISEEIPQKISLRVTIFNFFFFCVFYEYILKTEKLCFQQ